MHFLEIGTTPKLGGEFASGIANASEGGVEKGGGVRNAAIRFRVSKSRRIEEEGDEEKTFGHICRFI